MKRLVLLVGCLITLNLHGNAQGELHPGTALLFKDVSSKLNNYDKDVIFQKLEFEVAPDKTSFISIYDLDKAVPFSAFAYPTDMNHDGEEEVFVVYGNSKTSGAATRSVVVFIKDAGGTYRPHLGFPGLVEIISSINKGFADLLIGGPGGEYPVWRWDGKTYKFYKTITTRELQYFKTAPVAEVSRQHQYTLK